MFIASIAKQKVGGLDVPVDDVGSMQRLSCFYNLFGDVNLVGYLKRISDVIDILMQGMIVPVHIDQVVLEKILDEIGLIIYLPDDLELVLYFQQVSDVLIFAILLEGFLYKSHIQFLLGLGVYYAVLSVLDIKVSAFVFLLIYQPIVSPQLIFRILSHLKNTVLFSRVPLHHLRRLHLHQFTLSQQNVGDFILQLLFFRQNLAHEQVLMVHWLSYDNQQLNNVFFALQDFFLQLLIDFLGFLSALDAHCLINILQRLNALVNHEHYR